MNEIKKMFCIKKAKKVVSTLKARHYNALYVDTLEEAKKIILDTIPEGASVAMGGSVTLNEIDMIGEMRRGNYAFIDRFAAPNFEEEVACYREGLLADYFLCGTNVITEEGYLMNIDSSGNRVASMIFGPKNVIVVAGFNKIVKNMEEGFRRLENIAPMNCKRLKGHNNAPCVETGTCVDCLIPERMCNYVTIIKQGGKFPGRLTVIVVGEELGF